MNIEINEINGNKTSLFNTMQIYSNFTIGLEIKYFNKTRILQIIDDFSEDLSTLDNFKDNVMDALTRYGRLVDFYNFKNELIKHTNQLTEIYQYIDEKIKINENEIRYYLK
jgi:hypothetical protein